MPVPFAALVCVMFFSGVLVETFGVSWMTALHQEIPEDKFSRVSAYDWLGSLAMLPLATALAGPAEQAFGRTASLWGCAGLVALLTAAVLCVPDVRNLTRRSAADRTGDDLAASGTAAVDTAAGVLAPERVPGAAASPDAESPVGRHG